MHPDISPRTTLSFSTPDQKTRVGPLRRLLSAGMRRWQRRKMIATFEAMDDWMLCDIGLRREDILRVVSGYDEMRAPAVARRAPVETRGRKTRGKREPGMSESGLQNIRKAA